MTKKGARHRQKKSRKACGKGMRQTSNGVVDGYIFAAAPASPVLGRFQPLSRFFGPWAGDMSSGSPFAFLAAFLAFVFYSRPNGENLAPADRCRREGAGGGLRYSGIGLFPTLALEPSSPFVVFHPGNFTFGESSRAHARVSFLSLIKNIIYKEVFDDFSDNLNDIKPTL